MKKLSVLILALVCLLAFTGCCFHSEWYSATCTTPKTCVECGKTEGEALGHTWVEATCTDPKTCTTCNLTEGEALGHVWQEATTEAPKTCSTCAATEGERIITDPRFTTASTAELYGKWVSEISADGDMLGIEGFEGTMTLRCIMEMGNDGTLSLGIALANEDEFNTAMAAYLEETIYAELAASGLDREAADAAIMAAYGMTVAEYVDTAMAAMDFGTIFESMSFDGVYYVEDDKFYSGLSWDTALEPSNFQIDGDTLILEEDLAGTGEESMTFTRSVE